MLQQADDDACLEVLSLIQGSRVAMVRAFKGSGLLWPEGALTHGLGRAFRGQLGGSTGDAGEVAGPALK